MKGPGDANDRLVHNVPDRETIHDAKHKWMLGDIHIESVLDQNHRQT